MSDIKFNFEDLKAYQSARNLVKEVYLLIHKFPQAEQYALGDQLRRAIVSVPSNIAEGMSRHSAKEQIHFLEISYGSLMEVVCQLQLAFDLGYISIDENNSVRKLINETARIISGLRASIEKRQTLTPKL